MRETVADEIVRTLGTAAGRVPTLLWRISNIFAKIERVFSIIIPIISNIHRYVCFIFSLNFIGGSADNNTGEYFDCQIQTHFTLHNFVFY